MKVPVSWLKEYVDFEDTIEGLADKLTFAGLEVEAIETIGSDFEGVVVGEVVNVEPHPGADDSPGRTGAAARAEPNDACRPGSSHR